MAGVEGRSGRKPISSHTAEIGQTLAAAAVDAAKLVRNALRGTDSKGHVPKPLSGTKLKACELAISHTIGLPRQKVIIRTGDQLSLKELGELAEEHDELLLTQGVDVRNTQLQSKSQPDVDKPQPTVKYIPKRVKSGEN